jgi:uncharacterized protein YkwD
LSLILLRPDGSVFCEYSGETPAVVGRGDDAAFRLDDRTVSRAHARLSRAGNSFRVADLGAASGVLVNGMAVSQASLSDGDVLTLGDVALTVRLPEPPARAAAAAVAASSVDDAEPAVRPASFPTGRVLGAAAALVAAVFAYRALFTDPDAASQRLLAEASAAEARGEHAVAAATYDRAAEGASSALAHEARTRAKRAREAADRRSSAESELTRVVADVGRAALPELEGRVRAIARKYVDVVAAESVERELARLREAAASASRAAFASFAAEADARLGGGFFGDATRGLARAAGSPALLPADAARLGELTARVDAASRDALARLRAELASEAPAARVARLRRDEAAYVGSAAESDWRAAVAAEEGALVAVAKPVEAVAKAEPAPVAPKPDAARAAGAAETAFRARDYAKAAAEYAAAAGGGDATAAPKLRRAERLAAFHAALVARLDAEKAKLRGVPLGSELVGHLTHVDAERLDFDLGGGSKVRLFWAKIDADRLQSLLDRLPRTADEERALAEWWLAWREPERALASLARAAALDPDWPAKQTELVAEARGAAAPADGYVLVAGRFLTRAEEAEAAFVAKLAAATAELRAAPPGGFEPTAERLAELGPRGVEALVAALRERSAANVKAVGASPACRGAALESLRAKFFALLEERRAAALALIFDEKRYPYPYGPDQAEVQAEVDRLTDLVRDVWERPSTLILARAAGAKADPDAAALAALDADQALVAAVAARSQVALPADAVRAEFDRVVAMRTYAPDAKTRGLLDDAREIEAWNAGRTAVVGEFEREVHRVTNAYRAMMGRRAVMIDDRLVLAARGHSEEMARLGYFAHESPEAGRRSPTDRARLAGWNGGVSENIARGAPTPAAAVQGWIGSSGHHRNLLGAGHTHLGVGYAANGSFWTQNFGRGSPKPPKKD